MRGSLEVRRTCHSAINMADFQSERRIFIQNFPFVYENFTVFFCLTLLIICSTFETLHIANVGPD